MSAVPKNKPSYRDLVRAINSAYNTLHAREVRENYLLAELKKLAPDHVLFTKLSQIKENKEYGTDQKRNDIVQPIEPGNVSSQVVAGEFRASGMQCRSVNDIGRDYGGVLPVPVVNNDNL